MRRVARWQKVRTVWLRGSRSAWASRESYGAVDMAPMIWSAAIRWTLAILGMIPDFAFGLAIL